MRLPSSLLAGVMWFDPDRPDALSNIRHLAQDRDGTRTTTARPLAGPEIPTAQDLCGASCMLAACLWIALRLEYV